MAPQEPPFTLVRTDIAGFLGFAERGPLPEDFSGKHFTVTCDGKKAIELDDETFTEAGMVGLWTKADSVTLFDDFIYGSR